MNDKWNETSASFTAMGLSANRFARKVDKMSKAINDAMVSPMIERMMTIAKIKASGYLVISSEGEICQK